MPFAADVVDLLLDPWRSGITTRALLEILLIALAAGPLGCWVVLFGLSYGAESLTHAMLPGLVIAALAGFPLMLGAALGVADRRAGRGPGRPAADDRSRHGDRRGGHVAGRSRCAACAGAGVAGRQSRSCCSVTCWASRAGELLLTAALVVVVLAALRVAHGKLLTVGFDRANAPAFGASPRAADTLLLLLIGAFTIVAVQALGTLLVLAMLVGPAATARLVTDRLAEHDGPGRRDRRGRRRDRALPLLLRGHRGRRVDRGGDRRRPHRRGGRSQALEGLASKAHLKAGPVTGLEAAP